MSLQLGNLQGIRGEFAEKWLAQLKFTHKTPGGLREYFNAEDAGFREEDVEISACGWAAPGAASPSVIRFGFTVGGRRELPSHRPMGWDVQDPQKDLWEPKLLTVHVNEVRTDYPSRKQTH